MLVVPPIMRRRSHFGTQAPKRKTVLLIEDNKNLEEILDCDCISNDLVAENNLKPQNQTLRN
jgi:hypothetical protein